MKTQRSIIKARVTAAELKKKIGEQSFYTVTLADGQRGSLIATEMFFDVTLALAIGDRILTHGEIELAPEIRQAVTPDFNIELPDFSDADFSDIIS